MMLIRVLQVGTLYVRYSLGDKGFTIYEVTIGAIALSVCQTGLPDGIFSNQKS
jgi:hypothetical protein